MRFEGGVGKWGHVLESFHYCLTKVLSVGRLFGVEPAELFAQSFESAMVTVSCSAVER